MFFHSQNIGSSLTLYLINRSSLFFFIGIKTTSFLQNFLPKVYLKNKKNDKMRKKKARVLGGFVGVLFSVIWYEIVCESEK